MRDSGSASAVYVQLPGATVNNRMGEATIRDLLSKNPIERIYVCRERRHQRRAQVAARRIRIRRMHAKAERKQAMYDALAKDFRENNTGFGTRREFEAINANLQAPNIERVVGNMGLKVNVEPNPVDLTRYEPDMDCDEKLLVLMYLSSHSLSSVADIERKKAYAMRAPPEDVLPGAQFASNMGIRRCDMIALTSEEYRALKLARDQMRKDEIAGGLTFAMRKAG